MPQLEQNIASEMANMLSLNLRSAAMKVLIASSAAIFTYCLFTFTLAPTWVLCVVLPIGLIWAIVFVFPTYILIRKIGATHWLYLFASSYVLCLISATILCIFIETKTLFAFLMPLVASWDLSLTQSMMYWLVAAGISCAVGTNVLNKLEKP
ncbi:MAG: hypothetical protein RLZZ502_847 [Pseudomonadota bacterium]|jgi:hypothetical protein